MYGLDRGLRILEILIARGQAMSFTEINSELGIINRASLSKLLKELEKLEYVCKSTETGLYSYGRRTGIFLHLKDKSRKEYLTGTYGEIMKAISQKFNVTVLLFERTQDSLLCIWKENTLHSINMQPIGHLTESLDLPPNLPPWLAAVYACDKKLYAKVKDKILLKELDRAKKEEFAFDNQVIDKNTRRLGFVIKDMNNEIIGALGIGGTTLHITDSNLKQIIAFVKRKLSYEKQVK